MILMKLVPALKLNPGLSVNIKVQNKIELKGCKPQSKV